MAEWYVMLNDRILNRFWVEEGKKVKIGRGKDADVSLDNTAVSRHHATLEMRNGTHLLTDLGSVNGTLVNGRKIEGTVAVTGADCIEIAKFRFVLVSITDRASLPAAPADIERTVFVARNGESSEPTGEQTPWLTVLQGGATPNRLSLEEKQTVTLGRDAACDVRVPGWLVAKTHCYILAGEGHYYLAHHAGWSRTTLNGRKVHGKQRLHKGDTIGIGGSKLMFK